MSQLYRVTVASMRTWWFDEYVTKPADDLMWRVSVGDEVQDLDCCHMLGTGIEGLYRSEVRAQYADIGILTGYSTSAVSMTAVALRHQGELLPLRGYVVDMGSYPTHKAIIVRLYLQGLLTPEIAARTYHTKESVDRYIRGFERVRLLAAKHAREELPLLTGMAPRVLDQYLELLDEHLAATSMNRRRRRVSS